MWLNMQHIYMLTLEPVNDDPKDTVKSHKNDQLSVEEGIQDQLSTLF